MKENNIHVNLALEMSSCNPDFQNIIRSPLKVLTNSVVGNAEFDAEYKN